MHVKTLRFLNQMLHSSNQIVSYIGNTARSNANSPVGKNMSFLRYKYDVNFNDTLNCNISRVNNAHSVFTLYQQGLINNLNNLLSVRDDLVYIDGFDRDMIESLITDITCN